MDERNPFWPRDLTPVGCLARLLAAAVGLAVLGLWRLLAWLLG